MATDQSTTTGTKDPAETEVIENELPAYRAISAGSIVSVVLGVGSVFCFTDLWFLIVAAAGVLVGLLSIRKIRRFPEILTGSNYAKVGIGLSLVFALSSVTHEVASKFLIDHDASRFARQFTDVIKDQPVNMVLWYQQPVEYRKTKTPDEIAEEVKQTKNPMTADPYREKIASVTRIKQRLSGQGEQIRFAKIESKAVDGLTVYANALFELDGPGSPDFPEKEQFFLVEMMKNPGAQANDWIVREIRYPYKPASSFVNIVKPVDDGHGH
ncbi:hypothetical protein P12x_003970 [Tundrisphaera lichenicola]|uniref:hypothetical protein n=1 Tax=Tundrisphaera lichenicola TaxID=2029860 RepID=UPI003EB9168A